MGTFFVLFFAVTVAAIFISDVTLPLKAAHALRARFRRARDERALRDAWPDLLFILSGALRAGVTLDVALDRMVEQAPLVVRTRLNDRLGETGAWLSSSKKIDRLFTDPSVASVGAALRLGLRFGGRMAPLMERSAQALRQRERIATQARALSAEARVSAWVVGLCPAGVLAALITVSPDYVDPLFRTREGALALGMAVVMEIVGFFWVRSAAAVEVE